MHKIEKQFPNLGTYSSWLVFTVALFVISEALRCSRPIILSGMSWLDAAATYGILGMIISIFAFLGASLLSWGESLALCLRSRALCLLPRAIAFSLFVTVWFNVLRLMLASYEILVIPIAPIIQLIVFFIIGLGLFIRYSDPLFAQMVTTGRRLRIVILPLLIIYTSLIVYAVVMVTYVGKPVSVISTETRQPPPNIVIIVLDSLTSRDMSLYGYSLPTTPNLERITEGWTVFENAHSTGTRTLANLPTVMTGRYPYTDRWYQYGDWAKSVSGWTDLPRILQSMGYETTYFHGGGIRPGMFHLDAGWSTIVVEGGNQSLGRDLIERIPGNPYDLLKLAQTEYLSFVYNPESVANIGLYDEWTSQTLDAAKTYLEEKALDVNENKPLFIYIHVNRPHNPFLGGEFMGTFLPVEYGFTDAKSQLPFFFQLYTIEEQPRIDDLRLRYDENIRKVDDEIASLIKELRQSGMYDNSLIIITADHGTNFTQGYMGYFTPMLLAAEHSIPLLVKWPGQTIGERVSGLVSNVDIMPTVLGAVGVQCPPGNCDGESLLNAGKDPNRVIYVRLPNEPATAAALSGDVKMVDRNGVVALFDLAKDPGEKNNLISTLSADKLKLALERFMQRVRDAQKTNAPPSSDGIVKTFSNTDPSSPSP